MAQEKWITVNGKHILLKEGQSVEDALNSNKGDNKNSKIEQLKKELEHTTGFFNKARIREKIKMLEGGYTSVEEMKKKELDKQQKAIKEYNEKQKAKEQEKINIQEKKEEQAKKDYAEANDLQRKQFDIIQKTNPMLDDYHVGIRSPKDIKSFDEVINDNESFSWGDFSKEDAKAALESGYITIYSSKEINDGAFVSTSKIQAEQYAGGGKVYSSKVKLKDVAWINGDEGQFARVETDEERKNRLFGD